LMDITSGESVEAAVKKYNVNEVYNLVALLSATREKNPASLKSQLSWTL
jgi:hypothetical protein